MKKPTLLVTTAAIVATIAAGIGTATLVSAESTTTQSNTSTTKHERRSIHRVRLEAKLNQAVRDGAITDTQKTALQAELKTLTSEHKAAISKTSTAAERQAERTKLKTELKAWASSNSFPLAKIVPKLAS